MQSTFDAANADGSGAIRIFGGSSAVVTDGGAVLTISPNGAYVAVTGAAPTPDIATDSMSGGSVRYYTPDAYHSAAWLSDSSGFDAAADIGTGLSIYRYLLSTPLNGSGRAPGSARVPNGAWPASLP